MPPKFKFTKDEIISAAFNLVREHGFSYLTARALAERLCSSSKVIFGLFKNMEEVQQSVIAAAKELYGSYIEYGLQSKHPFKGVGTQYILFSIKEPKLFQLLFMNEKKDVPELSVVLPLIDDNYEKILSSIGINNCIDKQNAEKIYRHLWIYTHGIATLCATKMCRFTSEEINTMMTEIYLGILLKIKENGDDKR